MWNLKEKRISLLGAHQNGVYSVAVNPVTNMVASGAKDRRVCLWEPIRTGVGTKPVRVHSGFKGDVNTVEFSADGDFLVSGCDSSEVEVFPGRVE